MRRFPFRYPITNTRLKSLSTNRMPGSNFSRSNLLHPNHLLATCQILIFWYNLFFDGGPIFPPKPPALPKDAPPGKPMRPRRAATQYSAGYVYSCKPFVIKSFRTLSTQWRPATPCHQSLLHSFSFNGRRAYFLPPILASRPSALATSPVSSLECQFRAPAHGCSF